MDDEPPHLTIAASNDPEELKVAEELACTNWIIRRHTANLLRVMRGAGRPEDLLSDLNELVKAIRSMESVSVWRFNEHYSEVLREALHQDFDEIAARYGTQASRILKLMEEYGIARRSRGAGKT